MKESNRNSRPISNIEIWNYLEDHPMRLKELLHKFSDVPESTLKRHLRSMVQRNELFKESHTSPFSINPYNSPSPLENERRREERNKTFKKHMEKLNMRVDMIALDPMIHGNTKVDLKGKYAFSKQYISEFADFLEILYYHFFFSNPHNWDRIKSPKDLRFKLTIEMNWDQEPEIYHELLRYQELCFQNKELIPLKHKFTPFGETDEDIQKNCQKRIGNKDKTSLNQQSFAEDAENERKKERSQEIKRKMKPKYLEVVKLEKEKWEGDIQRINQLEKLEHRIEREYVIFEEGELIIKWLESERHPGELIPWILTEVVDAWNMYFDGWTQREHEYLNLRKVWESNAPVTWEQARREFEEKEPIISRKEFEEKWKKNREKEAKSGTNA